MGVNTDVLLRHYAVAGPLMERLFGAIPFVWTTLPRGFDGPKIYHGPLSEKTRPKGPVVDVPTVAGVRRYPALSAERIEGLVRHGAVEFYSWSPTVAVSPYAGALRADLGGDAFRRPVCIGKRLV